MAVCLVLALVAAACGSSSKQASIETASATNVPYLGLSPCCSWGTSWSYNQFSPDALGIGDGLIYLPLAAQDVPSLTAFTPQLAKSWSVKGEQLTLRLRKGVRWQNGAPVTSKDLYDTVILDGTDGLAGWSYWTGVTAPNAHEVVLTARKGTNMVLAEDAILPTFIFPAKIYGRFVSKSLKNDEIAYYNENATNPSEAGKMSQYKAISSVFTRLASLKVPKLLGDGPFKLVGINTETASLVKWKGFYDARKVHVPGIKYYDNPNNLIYPQLYSGTADFSNVYMPPTILAKWAKTPDSHTADVPAFIFAFEFNDSHYPLNMTKVRQALAYIVPRNTAIHFTYGSSDVAGGLISQHMDGLPNYLNEKYLTKGEQDSLNTYPVDPGKATTLLKSAGFHKSNGKWIMPNGHPFTLTFVFNSATSDAVEVATVAAKALTAFGIPSGVDATQGSTVTSDELDGNFEVGETNVGGVDPLLYFEEYLGGGNNFPTLGNYAGKRGMGFGPTADVPGLGLVNIPQTITKEEADTGPGPSMNRLVWDWARLVNQQVPYLQYGTKGYQFPFSTRSYVDWPPLNNKAPNRYWRMVALGNSNVALAVMFESGYVRPRH